MYLNHIALIEGQGYFFATIMINFKKAHNFKILSLGIVSMFLFNNSLYADPEFHRDLSKTPLYFFPTAIRNSYLLRIPAGQNQTYRRLDRKMHENKDVGLDLYRDKFKIINQIAADAVREFVRIAKQKLEATNGEIKAIKVKDCSFTKGLMMTGSDIDGFKVYYVNIEGGLREELSNLFIKMLQEKGVLASKGHTQPSWIDAEKGIELGPQEFLIYSSENDTFPLLDEDNHLINRLDKIFSGTYIYTIDKTAARIKLALGADQLSSEQIGKILSDSPEDAYVKSILDEIKKWDQENIRFDIDELKLLAEIHSLYAKNLIEGSNFPIEVDSKNLDLFKITLKKLIEKGLVRVSLKHNALLPVWFLPDIIMEGFIHLKVKIDGFNEEEINKLLKEVYIASNILNSYDLERDESLIQNFDRNNDGGIEMLVEALLSKSSIVLLQAIDRLESLNDIKTILALLDFFERDMSLIQGLDKNVAENIEMRRDRLIIKIVYDLIIDLKNSFTDTDRKKLNERLFLSGFVSFINNRQFLKIQKEQLIEIFNILKTDEYLGLAGTDIGGIYKTQLALKTRTRESAYADWRNKPRPIDMFSEEALRGRRAFLRYGKGAESILPSGKGFYGQSAVAYLRPSSSLQDNISIIYNAFRQTQAYRNGKLRLYDYETLHHTFKIYVDSQDEPVPEYLQNEHKIDLQKSLEGLSDFDVYLEGVNWDGNDYKFVLQAYVMQQFLDIERKLRGRHLPRIDFSLAIIIDELTQEELNELLSLVEEYAKVPIGVQKIETVSLVHYKDQMLAKPISIEDIKLSISRKPSFRNINQINQTIGEQL